MGWPSIIQHCKMKRVGYAGNEGNTDSRTALLSGDELIDVFSEKASNAMQNSSGSVPKYNQVTFHISQETILGFLDRLLNFALF